MSGLDVGNLAGAVLPICSYFLLTLPLPSRWTGGVTAPKHDISQINTSRRQLLRQHSRDRGHIQEKKWPIQISLVPQSFRQFLNAIQEFSIYCIFNISEPERRILAQVCHSLTSMLETEVNFPIFFIHGPTQNKKNQCQWSTSMNMKDGI